jgi:hypothetical protein
MVEMKAVTREKFAEKLKQHQNDLCVLELSGWQVPILHGLIVLAADHPGVKGLHRPTQDTIQRVRGWCRSVFGVWGFTREEVEYLDKMREQAAGGRISDDKETGA